MLIHDNVLKEYLKNVYFVSGTVCGGKTSVCKEIAKKHGLRLYASDDMFQAHLGISSPVFQPSMNKSFSCADEFFGRTEAEYIKWLTDNASEELGFILLDLVRLSEKEPVICDCSLSPRDADRLTDPSRIVFLLRDPAAIMDEYTTRPDHEGFGRFLKTASDPVKAERLCRNVLTEYNRTMYDAVKNSPYRWKERNENTLISETIDFVEKVFGI